MLTVFSYKTHKDHLIFHLERYKIVEVEVGDNFEAKLMGDKLPSAILFHLNLTNYRSFFSDTNAPHKVARKFGVKVLNYGLYNISKKWLQGILTTLNLPSTNIKRENIKGNEKVIIKSDFNYGGLYERNLSQRALTRLGIICDFSQIPRFNEYRVLEAQHVPENLWTQEGLIIEKFIENDQDTYIRVFKYFNRYVLVKLKVPDKDIKKMSDSRDRRRFFYEKEQIPLITDKEFKDAIIVADNFFSGLNIDFGTVDIVTDNNGVNYIVDFNDTPFWGRPYWGAGNETNLISYLSKNKINIKYTARKTFNNIRMLTGL
jgi:hypothetical protein